MLNRIRQELKNIIFEIKSRGSEIEERVSLNVPFVCQFALPEHAELSLKKQLNPVDDQYWANTGARSQERYADWAFTMCGMASAAMALGYFKSETLLQPALLAEDALQHGVYIEDEVEISSMRYREFATWIEHYGLKAVVLSKLSIRAIQYALTQKSLVIVSVNPNIRGYNTAQGEQKGGHLVLVVGYDKNTNTISVNNPSGFTSTDTQISHTLPLSEFNQYFAGRGIVLSPTK